MPAPTAHQTPPDLDEVSTTPSQRRWILLATCLGLLAVMVSVSGLNVAQQVLAADLGASQSELLWIINGYTVALGGLSVEGVALSGDRLVIANEATASVKLTGWWGAGRARNAHASRAGRQAQARRRSRVGMAGHSNRKATRRGARARGRRSGSCPR